MYVLLFLTALLWGGTAVAGKLVLRELPPLTVGALRYTLAAVILTTAYRRELPAPAALQGRDVWMLLAIGVFGTFLNHVLFFLALLWAPAAHGAVIPPTVSPLCTIALAALFGRERIAREQVVGLALGIAGVLLVARPDRLLGGGATVLLGDALFLLGGTAWGIYSWLSKLAMHRLSPGATLTTGITIGTLLLLPAALAERPWTAIAAAGVPAWGALLYLSLGGTVLSFLWWNEGLRRVGAGQTAAFSNLVPVFGVLLAWLVLGERLRGVQLLGAVLAVAGVLTCQASIVRPALARLTAPSRREVR